jgi:transposase
MPAALRIELSKEEDRTLQELSLASQVPRRIKQRAQLLRLNADGMTVPRIAHHLHIHEHTVRATIRRWEKLGLGGLWEAQGRGGKRKWSVEDLNEVEQWLKEERSYTSRQVQELLVKKRGITLSNRQISRILKKKIMYGNG